MIRQTPQKLYGPELATAQSASANARPETYSITDVQHEKAETPTGESKIAPSSQPDAQPPARLFDHPVADAIDQSLDDARAIREWAGSTHPEEIARISGLSQHEATVLRQQACSMPVGELALAGRLEDKAPIPVLDMQVNPAPLIMQIETV